MPPRLTLKTFLAENKTGGIGWHNINIYKMNTLLYYIKRGLMALAVLLPLASCSNFIYDDEGDCSVVYRLKLRYDMNLLFADATAREVKSLDLYAFDDEDRQVWHTTMGAEALASCNHTITLPLAPGKYRLLAWCGLEGSPSFSLPDASAACTPADLHCRMTCVAETADGQAALSKEDLQPLFHGMIDVELPASDDKAEFIYEMPLMKDTKVFRVVMQHLSGEDLNPKDFRFSIEDVNGWLDYDNNLRGKHRVEYQPWALYPANAGVDIDPHSSRAITDVKAVVAEMTLNRLFMRDWTQHQPPMLTIRTKDGDLVASLPVIDYALLVKGEHNRHMDNQEYLDRMDECNMTLFLDEDRHWSRVVIDILSWRVVINNTFSPLSTMLRATSP